MQVRSCRIFRSVLPCVLLIVCLKSHFCLGQETRHEHLLPFVVGGIKSLESVSENVELFSKGVGIETGLQPFLDSIPESVDRSRPLGFLGLRGLVDNPLNENSFEPILLIPTKNAETLVRRVSDMGLIQNLKQRDGIWMFQASVFDCSAIEREGWLVVVGSQSADFGRTPSNLEQLLSPFGDRYDVFVSIYPKQCPPPFRVRVLDELKRPFDRGFANKMAPRTRSESEISFEKELDARFQEWFKETNQSTVGLKFNKPEATVALELTTQFEPNSIASKDSKQITEVPSLFSKFGFDHESMRSSWKLRLPTFVSDYAVSQIKEKADQVEWDFVNSVDNIGFSADSKRGMFQEAKAILLQTLQARNIDMLFLAGKNPSETVSLIRLTEPKRVETILQLLQHALRLKPEKGTIKMNIDKHKGVAIHQLTLKNIDRSSTPTMGSTGVVVLGDAEIAVGVSKEVLMIATGDYPVADLKKALDQTQTATYGRNNNDAVYCTELNVPHFLSGIWNTGSMVASTESPKVNGGDKLRIELRTVPDGLTGRIALDQGALGWLVNDFPKLLKRPMISSVEKPDAIANQSELAMSPPLKPRRDRIRDVSKDKDRSSRDAPVAQTESSHLQIAKFGNLTWGVKGMDFSPDGQFLAVGKVDEKVVVLDVTNKLQVNSVDKLIQLGSADLCMFTKGKKLLIGGQRGAIVVFSVADNGALKPVSEFMGHSSKGIQCLSISEDGKYAISGDQGKKVFCWDTIDGKVRAEFSGFEGPVKAVLFPRKGRIAYATDGAKLVEFDLGKRKVVKERKLTDSWANGQAAAFSANGEYVAVGDTYDIRLWNLKTGEELPRLMQKEIQWSMQFTPDSDKLLSGGSGKVNIWDVSNSKLHSVQTVGESGYIQSLAISQDGKQFAVPIHSEVYVYQFRE